MRVIAGKYKGRQLFSPKDQSVRPTTDRIKENVFNLLQGRVAGAAFLDLFGGSGAITVEALSRGAVKAVTVDASRESVDLIKRNFRKIGIGNEAQIVEVEYGVALKRMAGQKFDIIYLDPPYKAGVEKDVLDKISEGGFLADGGVVVLEHATEIPFLYEGALKVFDSRKYGSVTIELLSY